MLCYYNHLFVTCNMAKVFCLFFIMVKLLLVRDVSKLSIFYRFYNRCWISFWCFSYSYFFLKIVECSSQCNFTLTNVNNYYVSIPKKIETQKTRNPWPFPTKNCGAGWRSTFAWPQWWTFEDKTQLGVDFCSNISSGQIFFYFLWLSNSRIFWFFLFLFSLQNISLGEVFVIDNFDSFNF